MVYTFIIPNGIAFQKETHFKIPMIIKLNHHFLSFTYTVMKKTWLSFKFILTLKYVRQEQLNAVSQYVRQQQLNAVSQSVRQRHT